MRAMDGIAVSAAELAGFLALSRRRARSRR